MGIISGVAPANLAKIARMPSLPPLKCHSSNEILSVDQFEVVEREYKTPNLTTNEVETKTTKITDRVTNQMTCKDLYNKLLGTRKKYLMHKYHVYNDRYHWPIILSTIPRYGEITHSEDMSQLHKVEAPVVPLQQKSLLITLITHVFAQ